MKDTKKHTETKEKAAQIEEKLKEFLKDYNNEEFGAEEGRELLKLFRKFRRSEPEKIERSRNPDLLAAAMVYAYARWIGLTGHGGLTVKEAAEYFGVNATTLPQKVSMFDLYLHEMNEELIASIKEEYLRDATGEPINQENREFVDRNRFEVQERYWNLIEDENLSERELQKALEELIEVDPDFFDPYIVLYQTFRVRGHWRKAEKMLETGYHRALKLLDVDEDEPLPMLEWGYLENRHIARIVYTYAESLWEKGQTAKALAVLGRLLRSNPDDNIGARYAMAAILSGFPDQEEFESAFMIPGDYGLDPVRLDRWFSRVAADHPDVFGWWTKAMASRYE